ncbi:MAG: alpha/beta hydrolase [Candidatus Dojkabacteria bacterium]
MDDINSVQSYFTYYGYKIEYYEVSSPESDKLLIFINGFCDPIENHLDILSLVSYKGYRVIGINLPGHGNSAHIENVTWDLLEDIIRIFIHKNKITDFNIGGFSIGGGVALKYASLYPSGINGINVLSPFCYQLPNIKELIPMGINFLRTFHKNRLEHPGRESPSTKIYPIYYANHYSGITKDPMLNKENLVDIPIEVTIGSKDEVVNYEFVQEALSDIPAVKYNLIDNEGHDIYYRDEVIIERIAANLVK